MTEKHTYEWSRHGKCFKVQGQRIYIFPYDKGRFLADSTTTIFETDDARTGRTPDEAANKFLAARQKQKGATDA